MLKNLYERRVALVYVDENVALTLKPMTAKCNLSLILKQFLFYSNFLFNRLPTTIV